MCQQDRQADLELSVGCRQSGPAQHSRYNRRDVQSGPGSWPPGAEQSSQTCLPQSRSLPYIHTVIRIDFTRLGSDIVKSAGIVE